MTMAGTSPGGRGHDNVIVRSACGGCFWSLRRSSRLLHRILHLLEGANLDLANSLAGDAELGGQLFQRERILGETARLEHSPLALVQALQRGVEHIAAGLLLLVLGA